MNGCSSSFEFNFQKGAMCLCARPETLLCRVSPSGGGARADWRREAHNGSSEPRRARQPLRCFPSFLCSTIVVIVAAAAVAEGSTARVVCFSCSHSVQRRLRRQRWRRSRCHAVGRRRRLWCERKAGRLRWEKVNAGRQAGGRPKTARRRRRARAK